MQVQSFQVHAVLQDWVPFVSHTRVAPDAQAPIPEHADQVNVPSLQTAVCVPQLPHDRVVGPAHVHLPPWQLAPVGHE